MFGTFFAILFSMLALAGIGLLAYVVYLRHDQLSRDTRKSLTSKTNHIQNEIDGLKKKVETRRLKLNKRASLSTSAPFKETRSPPSSFTLKPYVRSKEPFISAESSSSSGSESSINQSPWLYLTNASGSEYLSGGLAAASTWLRDSLLIDNGGIFCMGTTCIDTIAFGQLVTSTGTVHSNMIQAISTNVAKANNGLPPSASQSVIQVVFVGGDYSSLVSSPVSTAAADFTSKASTAIQQHLSALGYSNVKAQIVHLGSGSIVTSFLLTYQTGQSAASGTTSLLSTLGDSSTPVAKAMTGLYGISSVSGKDITKSVGSHITALSMTFIEI